MSDPQRLAAEEEFLTWITEPDKWTLLNSTDAVLAGWLAFRNHMPQEQWDGYANDKIVMAVLAKVRERLMRMHVTMLEKHGIAAPEVVASGDD